LATVPRGAPELGGDAGARQIDFGDVELIDLNWQVPNPGLVMLAPSER
jgi:hypothetical protein